MPSAPEPSETVPAPRFLPGLYVVATPIGNLGDLTERARAVLAHADTIAAEDTRTTLRLLSLSGGQPRLVSLTEHNLAERVTDLVEAAKTSVVALVSEAGTPLIADPAARLVAAAHRAGVRVSPVPGPSALTAALSVAGFEATSVHFAGFAPKKEAELRALFERVRGSADVLVLFTRASRLAPLLDSAADALGDPEAVVCRELTKVHEEVVRGRCRELARRFRSTRGETTVVIALPEPEPDSLEQVRRLLDAMRRAGARRSLAAAEVARLTGLPRRTVYRLWGELGAGDAPEPPTPR